MKYTTPEGKHFDSLTGGIGGGGLFIESEAHGFSFGYVQALARTVERAGGRIASRTNVKGLLLDGRRVKGVRIGSNEAIEGDVVVLAAGSWSKRLGEGVGVGIPLQPAKGYSATIDIFEGAPRVPVLIKERRVTMTPLGDRVRFGGTLELTGFDSSIDRVRYGAVVKAARSKGLALERVEDFEAVAGKGVRARVAGRPVLVGTLRFLDESGITTGLAGRSRV